MHPPRPPALVSIQSVTKRYNSQAGIQDVSLDVEPGTIVGIIGPSGSGKTTLVRVLTGTLPASSGTARVLGEDPRHFHRAARERIGYMPQNFVLFEELTASENVSFVAALFGLLWRRRRRRVREVLQLLGLWDARKRRARHLSGGMQRRLELACALVHEPVLLFVDEPTAGLDPELRQLIWTEFRRLRDQGRALVVTTQYVGEAEFCDKVAVLREGRLIAFDDPETLRRNALGGEVIEIETEQIVDGSALRQVAGVLDIRQRNPRRVLVIVEQASAATPRVLELLHDQQITVTSSAEYRPTFDEVFAAIVNREEAGARDRAA